MKEEYMIRLVEAEEERNKLLKELIDAINGLKGDDYTLESITRALQYLR